MTLKQRFLSHVTKTKNCWEWRALRIWSGYGQIRVKKRMEYAHRIAFSLFQKKIPIGLCVLHKCDNRGCVNPKHLFLGTNQDNIDDKVRKGRQAHLQGEENGFSKLKKKEVDDIRSFYLSGEYTQKSLAKRFNVSRVNIGYIVRNKAWI